MEALEVEALAEHTAVPVLAPSEPGAPLDKAEWEVAETKLAWAWPIPCAARGSGRAALGLPAVVPLELAQQLGSPPVWEAQGQLLLTKCP